ncbi:MAG: polysaccharide biosynthesis/export family protein [Gemmataceae bacterium]
MGAHQVGRFGWWLIALAAFGTGVGCSTSSGGKMPFSHDCNTLTCEARTIREAACPPPGAPRELSKQPAEAYVVEPGDVLLVQPANLDSPLRLPGDQVVLPDGVIQVGRFGRMCVAGKTIEQIEADINALARTQAPEAGPISVRLVTRDSKVFYVLGEVNAPGAFPLRGRETVLDAIVAAGGLNSKANRHGILLARPSAPDGCRIVLPVEYNDIVQLGDTTTNYQVRAGDRIFVPSKSLWEEFLRLIKWYKRPWCRNEFGCPTCGGHCTACHFPPAATEAVNPGSLPPPPPATVPLPAAPVSTVPATVGRRSPDLLPPAFGQPGQPVPDRMPPAPPLSVPPTPRP